ncbi:helicase [Microbacterium sp. NPDC055357]
MAAVPAVVGVVAAVALLATGLAAAGGAAVFGQRLAGAADAAALAAADAASGAAAGVPCERAAQLAALGGATLATCDVDGLIATVSVTGRFGVFTGTAAARAGPPSQSP